MPYDALVRLMLSFIKSLSLPNEDFGRRNKRWNQDFRSTFQGCEYSIWATNHRKVSRKSWFHHLLFILPKSSFGEHKVCKMNRVKLDSSNMWCVRCVRFSGMLCSFVTSLCSPNEDFGMPNVSECFFEVLLCLPNEDFGFQNKRTVVRFRITYQGCEYSIWETMPWKLHRKCTPELLFWNPKSSFGKHNFSTICIPNRVLTPLKSASRVHYFHLCQSFPQLRLVSIKFKPPKRRCGKEEQ